MEQHEELLRSTLEAAIDRDAPGIINLFTESASVTNEERIAYVKTFVHEVILRIKDQLSVKDLRPIVKEFPHYPEKFWDITTRHMIMMSLIRILNSTKHKNISFELSGLTTEEVRIRFHLKFYLESAK